MYVSTINEQKMKKLLTWSFCYLQQAFEIKKYQDRIDPYRGLYSITRQYVYQITSVFGYLTINFGILFVSVIDVFVVTFSCEKTTKPYLSRL